MTQMTHQQLAARDAFVAEATLTQNAAIRDMIDITTSEIAALTDADEAMYLYLYIQGFYSLLDQVAPPFEDIAHMVKIDPVEFEAVKSRATARKVISDEISEREINMRLAKAKVDSAIEQFGQDSDQARMAMAKAIQFLPDDIKADLDAKAREMGLMPPASGYTTDGQPVFTVEALASHFGMDPEEVMRDVGEYGMTVDAATIHLPQ